MPEHPTESCLIICEGQVLPSSQMFEQQAEICQKKKAQKRPRCQEDSAIPELILINFNDTDEIHTEDFNKSSYFRVKLKRIKFEPILNQTWTRPGPDLT